MLLTFTGKNFKNCPFLSYVSMAKIWKCNLVNRQLCDGSKIDLLVPNVEPEDPQEKPKGCPFRDFPSTLEIEARNE